MMRRREFLAGIGSTAAAWPLLAGAMPALAQTPNRVYRLGHLGNSAASEAFTRQITLPELARLGFAEGRNLEFDSRVGGPDAVPGLMRELLAARPDAVIAIGPTAIAAAGAATRTVPVVAFGADLIELKLAASYARPGLNVTGVVILANELEVSHKRGDRVSVAADEPVKTSIEGEIVALSLNHIAIRRQDSEVGEVVVHFPRLGYIVSKA